MGMLSMLLVVLVSSCTDDDIVVVADSINANKTVEEINTNIKAFQQLLAAEEAGEEIVSCVKTADGSYNVELEDGNSFNVLTAITAIGDDKRSAYSPLVSAASEGGTYYWTVDGDYLLVDGNKQQAVGGSVPVVGTADDYWTVALAGSTQQLSSVESGTISSLFTDVITSSDATQVKFSLRGDKTSITLALKKSGTTGKLSPTWVLRRPITPDHPAWLVHIDTWTVPDPQAIIDLIPDDIKPYVIFNIALSTMGFDSDGVCSKVADGYELAKSWLRTCAENNVWAMVQGASGGPCHWPDVKSYEEFEGSLFEEFYQDYPNFVGFNYAEQGWGYGGYCSTFEERVLHFSHLLRLSNEYGGYLCVSFFNPDWGANCNAIAMVKQHSEMEKALQTYPENFIGCEKFTNTYGYFDMESTSMGLYAAGLAGNYGIRFDQCGWYTDDSTGAGWNGDDEFPVAAGAIPVIEHVTFTGETVIDGPELIWQQCFHKTNDINVGDGYTGPTWSTFPQFTNISMDIFRKIIDGTIRIMTREEYVERTKVVVVNDLSPTGSRYDPGLSPPSTLFQGLYLMDEDGIQQNHHLWFKKTGRYPSIPTVPYLQDALAKTFSQPINASQFTNGSEWSDISTKQSKFNEIFPEEYTTDGMYAGRYENEWVAYNAYADARTADIPFKYNTCDKMVLSFGKYSVAVIREYSNKVDFYLNNYTTDGTSTTDIISIYGSTSRPSYSFVNRISGNTCSISEAWSDGVYKLTVVHNGAADITINCEGSATGRETAYTPSTISAPATPDIYYGTRQYEVENFDYKNISQVVSNAIDTSGAYTGYTALGYLSFGQSESAAVRKTISVAATGVYTIKIRYCAPTAAIGSLGVYINGSQVATPILPQTSGGTWQTVSVSVSLNKGSSTLEIKANAAGNGALYLDNITVSSAN